MRAPVSAVLACFVALTAASTVACGSSTSAVDVLRGEYVATTAGPIRSVDFEDGVHYSMVKSACSDGAKSCSESGTYALASDDSTVTFTSKAGAKTVYPFQTLSTGASFTGSPTTLAAHILGGAALTDPGGSLTSGNGTSLTSGTGSSLTSGSAALTSGSNNSLIAQVLEALIGAFNMGSQGFQSGSDAGTGDDTSSSASDSSSSSAASSSSSSSSTGGDAGAGDASDAGDASFWDGGDASAWDAADAGAWDAADASGDAITL